MLTGVLGGSSQPDNNSPMASPRDVPPIAIHLSNLFICLSVLHLVFMNAIGAIALVSKTTIIVNILASFNGDFVIINL